MDKIYTYYYNSYCGQVHLERNEDTVASEVLKINCSPVNVHVSVSISL